MFKLSNWKLLRISFSFYLLPVFLFALAHSPNLDGFRLLIVFLALHLFLYPSSNAYNSFFDKDELSIAGIKHPPKVTPGLLYLSFIFLFTALVLGVWINLAFAGMVLLYALVSMAYSHPAIRLKKYPFIGWITAGFFQGLFTFAMAYAGLNGFGWNVFEKPHVLIPGLLTSLMILGNYPLTQVYQHEEDGRRGDRTMSLYLGYTGTFVFSSIWFLIAGAGFIYYFLGQSQIWAVWAFLAGVAPAILFFYTWFYFVRQNAEKYATYPWAMWMIRLSALGLNVFFAYYFLERTQVLQVI
ncbi:UbiA prenyltransferase family protein [Litoribacter ruber]|uniref:UbiA family prenyltransferase n=1 Tax=Litoribacter ruber TaxID=702568 RepID=UPI001BDA4415|nr:UbiA family prenyltransferase [Litoribacter ruber]MBT0812446.1 UbiA prenyltransferase family protein [Litoribacter ruber]